MAEKVYYFLKLEEGFFRNKAIKALRKLPGGSDLVICYLKMQLAYMNTEGFIIFQEMYETIEEEIAEDIDEELNIVQMTVTALKKWKCLEIVDKSTIFLNEVPARIGQKSQSALRVARHREKMKALQCNVDVTNCNVDVTNCNVDVTNCNADVTNCNADVTPMKQNVTIYRDRDRDREEIDIDIEKEIDKIESVREREDEQAFEFESSKESSNHSIEPLPFTQYLLENSIIENDNMQIATINSVIRFYKAKKIDENTLKNTANEILKELISKELKGNEASDYFSERFDKKMQEVIKR